MRPAKWVKCNGEAHRNPMIDHCMVCMPFWGEYPVCPDCDYGLFKSRNPDKLFCLNCRKHFSRNRG